MAVTKTTNFSTVTPREIDFVTRFGRNFDALRNIMGVSRPIKKEPGAVLKSKTASVTLDTSTVAEGGTIPYLAATVTESTYSEMSIDKFAKAVTIEAIKSYGYDVAIGKTDDEFLYELQAKVLNKFYTYLNTGTLTATKSTWQKALAHAKGAVLNKFAGMNRECTEVVGFVNIMDAYNYLGVADVTVQTAFGVSYIENFLGYKTLFLCDSNKVAAGKVLATPAENLVIYYVDPGDSDFAKAGLEFTTDGDTNLIGFHTQGSYSTAVSESYAIMGVVMFAEYLDGIANVTVGTESSSSAG